MLHSLNLERIVICAVGSISDSSRRFQILPMVEGSLESHLLEVTVSHIENDTISTIPKRDVEYLLPSQFHPVKVCSSS